jgi:putative endonuclease
MQEIYYVYVLESLKNGRRYTGSTNDLVKRLKEHNNGRSKYTSKTGPYVLIHSEIYPTQLEARRRERYLKTGKGRLELDKLLH